MTDTPPEVEHLYREMLMKRSNEERFIMGIGMCEAARAMVLASLPKDLSESEIRVQLFLRYYGNDFDDKTRERIIEHLRRTNGRGPEA
jgi:hypothetical protein